MPTPHQILCLGLLADGHAPSERNGPWEVFESKRMPHRFYFVGRNGELRVGPTLATSAPVGPRPRAYYWALGEASAQQLQVTPEPQPEPEPCLTLESLGL